MPVLHPRLALSVSTALVLAAATVAATIPADAAGCSTHPVPTATACPAGAATRPAPAVLARVHTVGRFTAAGAAAVQYTWPGIYFEGRFHGTGVGIVLNDANNDYDVQIDGATTATLVTPGQTTYRVSNLSNADHTVRLVKRSESPFAAGQFGGFVAAPGGRILTRPAARRRQIEFIGDSFTAGYGNMSGTRDCSTNGGVNRNTNADLSFGALTARSLNADYQIIAQSGIGMVRNFNGSSPDTDFPSIYDKALQSAGDDIWHDPPTWRPQLIVVGLGINDFSTPLNPGERWATTDALVAAYVTAYQGFLDKLRARYGRRAVIVVSATLLSNTTLFADTAQQIVKDRNNHGDNRIAFWYYDDPNLDRLGCDFHPSVHDDRIISGLLDNVISTLPLFW